LLPAARAGWRIEVVGEDAEELPYVDMTRRLIEAFPPADGHFRIEPDASSGSYFWGAGSLWAKSPAGPFPVRVAHWPDSGWQIDQRFPEVLARTTLSRRHDLGDSIMTAVVLAPFGNETRRFTDLARLRVQECERVMALRTELHRCGARVEEQGDTLVVHPSSLHGAEIETYDDHRIAMCFALVGLRTAGIRLRNPACVRKTFPHFFAKLSLPPPAGLGVRFLEAGTGRTLTGADLLPGGAA
jgi:3-phosphoshikimate 1-carboxyvinyltransferase